MQNRYVGDIGDYVKLAILRQLAAGMRLGVAWWLFPDESHNADGGRREYLTRPNEWRSFDCELFDRLSIITEDKRRSVAALESLIPSTFFAGEPVPCEVRPFSRRPAERKRWLLDMKLLFKDRNLLFLDPDNGIAPTRLRPTRRCAGKSVFINDIKELKESNQAMVVYHHLTRRKGGHKLQLRHFAEKLRDSGFEVLRRASGETVVSSRLFHSRRER